MEKSMTKLESCAKSKMQNQLTDYCWRKGSSSIKGETARWALECSQ